MGGGWGGMELECLEPHHLLLSRGAVAQPDEHLLVPAADLGVAIDEGAADGGAHALRELLGARAEARLDRLARDGAHVEADLVRVRVRVRVGVRVRVRVRVRIRVRVRVRVRAFRPPPSP